MHKETKSINKYLSFGNFVCLSYKYCTAREFNLRRQENMWKEYYSMGDLDENREMESRRITGENVSRLLKVRRED